MIRERALAVDHKEVDGKQIREKGVYVLRGPRRERKTDRKRLRTPKETRSRFVDPSGAKIGNPGVVRDGFVEIEKGVRAGDWVVVSGMQRLKNGKVVKAEKYAGDAPARERQARQNPNRSPPRRKARTRHARLPE